MASSRVPPPGLKISRRPSTAEAVREAAQAATRPRLGAADPVVGDLDCQLVIAPIGSHEGARGSGVLGDVASASDDEIGGRLDRRREPPVCPDLDGDIH